MLGREALVAMPGESVGERGGEPLVAEQVYHRCARFRLLAFFLLTTTLVTVGLHLAAVAQIPSASVPWGVRLHDPEPHPDGV